MPRVTDNKNLISDAPCAELSADCELIRVMSRDNDPLPTADPVGLYASKRLRSPRTIHRTVFDRSMTMPIRHTAAISMTASQKWPSFVRAAVATAAVTDIGASRSSKTIFLMTRFVHGRRRQ